MPASEESKPSLVNQIAVVTGGGRGFGRAIAVGLAEAGAAVVVTARTKEQLDDTVVQIKKSGGRGLAVAGDITSATDAARVRQETEGHFGGASILIHAAGVAWPFGPTWYVDPERWWQAQNTHVRGAMLYIHEFVPGMIERGSGHVILVAGDVGRRLRPNLSGYGIAKATLIRLASFLAEEAREYGVYAFSIAPGNVLTDLSKLSVTDPDAQKFLPEWVADLKRRMEAGEDGSEGLHKCAELCVNLTSGQFDTLTGQYLTPEDDLPALVRAAEPPTSH